MWLFSSPCNNKNISSYITNFPITLLNLIKVPCPFLYKIKMYQRQLTKPSSFSIIRYHMLFPFLFGCVIYLEVNLYYYQIQSISRYQMSSITACRFSLSSFHLLFSFYFCCVIYLEVNLYYYQIQSISRYQMSSTQCMCRLYTLQAVCTYS